MKRLVILLLLSVLTLTVSAQDRKCIGKKTDGTECKMKVGINKAGYCVHHNPDTPTCAMIKGNGERCKNKVKKGVTYCRWHKKG
jgi:hypothetical protein